MPGTCGRVTFINYGGGAAYVIIDCYRGDIWFVDLNVLDVGNGREHVYPFVVGNASHWEQPLEIPNYSGGRLVLTGIVVAQGFHRCGIEPNPDDPRNPGASPGTAPGGQGGGSGPILSWPPRIGPITSPVPWPFI